MGWHFWKPPVFDDDDTTRLAALLHTLLLAVIVVLSVYMLSQVGKRGYTTFSFFISANGALILVSMALLIIMRRGYVRAAATAILVFAWLNITAQIWVYGGTRDASFAAYSIVLAAAGLLLTYWHCLAFTVMSILAGFGMAYAETIGMLPYQPDPPYQLWVDHSLNFVLLTAILLLIRTSLDTALQRARRGEQALQERNRELEAIRATLEERVAERTHRLTEQNAQLQAQINERQQAEAALQEALEREREMLDDVRLNLSLALPHELRTPLNTVLGFSELLVRPEIFSEPERVAQYAENLRKGAARLHRVVENALLYANLRFLRYTDTTMSTRLTRAYSVKYIVESVATHCAERVGRSDDLRLDLHDFRVYAQPEHVKKILTELLDNAFKFSQPGTPVSVKTQVHDRCYALYIVDQGRGMTARQIQAIGGYVQFERRYYEQQGIGLGLVLASLLTQLEGGELTFSSEKDAGTCVRLRFECFPEQEAECA